MTTTTFKKEMLIKAMHFLSCVREHIFAEGCYAAMCTRASRGDHAGTATGVLYFLVARHAS